MGGYRYLASCEHLFIRVHENLVQHPSNNIFIIPNDIFQKSAMLIDNPTATEQDLTEDAINETQADKGGFKIRIFLDSARIEVS